MNDYYNDCTYKPCTCRREVYVINSYLLHIRISEKYIINNYYNTCTHKLCTYYREVCVWLNYCNEYTHKVCTYKREVHTMCKNENELRLRSNVTHIDVSENVSDTEWAGEELGVLPKFVCTSIYNLGFSGTKSSSGSYALVYTTLIYVVKNAIPNYMIIQKISIK